MTLTVSLDLACPGALRTSSVVLRGLPLPSRMRVLFPSIYSYCSRSQIGRKTMTNTLQTAHIRKVLDRLFAAASFDNETPRWTGSDVTWESATAQERADALQDAYLPISARGG